MSDDRLSGLDTSFLHLERDGAHMHVASTAIFEGPTPHYKEFVDHIDSRLHLVPRFRQRLRFVPLGAGRPVWEDDPSLNLRYHVRHTALPSPGSDEQLRTLAARVFSQRLDRSKPLWELWLVDGLEGGRFAVVGKSHHCLVDGVSGVDLTTVLYDTEREPETPPAPPGEWVPGPGRSGAQLFGETVVERLTSPTEIARGVGHQDHRKRLVFPHSRSDSRAGGMSGPLRGVGALRLAPARSVQLLISSMPSTPKSVASTPSIVAVSLRSSALRHRRLHLPLGAREQARQHLGGERPLAHDRSSD